MKRSSYSGFMEVFSFFGRGLIVIIDIIVLRILRSIIIVGA